ncbi:tryptophan 2,3-dioxygenase [Pseudorhodoplanes sinuspersici]|uniref:Tryptophan 2,3-dioxygenase n=2 Tax=Pseudorhodoplanes sinuspersici TaxID=1235591 RepID=A0A1W6ZZJ1_9HYPH|nr:tryptophan 2,3-dioxygenase [Pseudorhodoplanes sinuspersici]
MTYGDYLQLKTLLAAQKPLTKKHDEHLFIIIHHVQELWLNLMAHELNAAIDFIERDQLPPAFKSMARMTRILEQMISAWNVLSTMTPSDYLEFRNELGQSSGFQSFQYRMVEFRLGAKDPKMLLPHRHDTENYERLKAALEAPSLYDVALMLLKRRGFAIPDDIVNRDFSVRHVFSDAVRDAWLKVYRNSKENFEVYELAEELVDLEDWFQQWRFRHMKTVERIIGFKRGTGGSSGVAFLKSALDHSFFPELWAVRTEL